MNSYTEIDSNLQDKPLTLQIRCKTWIRDSHGLFDFENNQVKNATMLIKSNGSLIRRKHDIKYLTALDDNEKGTDEEEVQLGKIRRSSDKFILSSPLGENMPVNNQTLTDLQEKIWYVVKTNNSNMSVVNTNNSYLSNFKYELKKNDIIKLGRIKFLIKDINAAEGQVQTTQQTFRPYLECDQINPGEGDICRICLFNSNDYASNPIISICKCKGSINLIHLNCLKLWLQQKLTVREITNKPGISYTIKSFNCELCKEPYPTTIKFKENTYHLLNYCIPEGQNYIILESLNSIKENQYPLSIHVLMYIDSDEYFILGRGHDSDVRISDISVSRSHAKIAFRDKQFLLKDTGSKFGTLVLAKDSVTFGNKPIILQVGRTLLSVREFEEDETRKSLKEEKVTQDVDLLNIEEFSLDPKDKEEEEFSNINALNK